jgi:glycerophosphoryl diester phosphodiesterase
MIMKQQSANAATLLMVYVFVMLTGCSSSATQRRADSVTVLECAHAHNDYHHDRPLLDALDHGFASVEADVFLVNDELLLGHHWIELNSARTLRSCYLEPLQARIRHLGGRVYEDQPERFSLILLVDIKTNADKTYRVLNDQLSEFKTMLTWVQDGQVHPGPVTVVVSGNRPVQTMHQQEIRYASLDGRPSDLDRSTPAHLIPLISASWNDLFDWRGAGPIPEDELQKLRSIVRRAHAQDRKVRFWATPENTCMWDLLTSEDVDLINTDQLAALRAFLLNENRVE